MKSLIPIYIHNMFREPIPLLLHEKEHLLKITKNTNNNGNPFHFTAPKGMTQNIGLKR